MYNVRVHALHNCMLSTVYFSLLLCMYVYIHVFVFFYRQLAHCLLVIFPRILVCMS